VKKILLFLCLCSILHASDLYNWQVSRVVDGDTVEVKVDFLPKELGNKLKIRIWGIDTPEKGWRALTMREADLGEAASIYTSTVVKNAKEVKVTIISWDKFGGRMLGDVIVDGKSLRLLLIQNGYAREYYGDKKELW
jgi:endonuclease YncB( thermonuclease family)